MKLTNDMIAMMPNKIDKINYGMVSPLEWMMCLLWLNKWGFLFIKLISEGVFNLEELLKLFDLI